MELLSDRTVSCPCCGERIALRIDASAGAQAYTEDCPVCCRPLRVEVEVDAAGEGGRLRVDVRSEQDG